MGFSDLREVSDNDWKEMKIARGFVKRIQKHLKEYARRPPSRESEVIEDEFRDDGVRMFIGYA